MFSLAKIFNFIDSFNILVEGLLLHIGMNFSSIDTNFAIIQIEKFCSLKKVKN